MSDSVLIRSRDYWVKVVEMLQQNWALIDPGENDAVRVYFISDTSGVFDEIVFPSVGEAHRALGRNGFRRIVEDRELQSFLTPPPPPFRRADHPNGPIYSSGRFWK